MFVNKLKISTRNKQRTLISLWCFSTNYADRKFNWLYSYSKNKVENILMPWHYLLEKLDGQNRSDVANKRNFLKLSIVKIIFYVASYSRKRIQIAFLWDCNKPRYNENTAERLSRLRALKSHKKFITVKSEEISRCSSYFCSGAVVWIFTK